MMQTFAAVVILAGLPQADQRGKQNLLQLKLKKYTFLVDIAQNSTELLWSSSTDSDLTQIINALHNQEILSLS